MNCFDNGGSMPFSEEPETFNRVVRDFDFRPSGVVSSLPGGPMWRNGPDDSETEDCTARRR
jgi:hypothetical protein